MMPIYAFEPIKRADANALLVRWGHRMGALNRPVFESEVHCVLIEHGEPVAVAMTAGLVREHVGGGNTHMTRENTIELARLCAARTGLCRVALRLWREGVFPMTGKRFAVSYQDADMHSGATYRFDGWKRIGFSASGVDQRTGRKGRRKWIWSWEAPA